MVKKLLLLLFALNCMVGFAQKFSFVDAEGCSYSFRVTSTENHEVALVSASNKKHAKLEIPGTVTNKGVEYSVTSVRSESLKGCDTKLRVLSFPNTVKEIEGFLFGSAMKLMGGFASVFKAGLGSAISGADNSSPMSIVTLKSLRIPSSVSNIGMNAFATSLSSSGNKPLKAHIDELPDIIVPNTAEGYGLQQSAVAEYWDSHNAEMLSPVIGASASIEMLQNHIKNMSPRQRKSTLNMFESNSQFAGLFMQSFEAAGFTREDVIDMLNGEEVTPKITAAQPSVPTVPIVQTPKTLPAIQLISDVDKNIPQSTKENENTFVVIIANEQYQEEVPVEFAANDGAAFKMYCHQVLGVPEENIHIRQNATLNNMLSEFDWLNMVASAFAGEARIILYYAGHGIPDEATGNGYLLPVDGIGRNLRTGYSLSELYKQLGVLPAKSITVFMDACFSGSKRGEGMLSAARGIAIKVKPQKPQGKVLVLSASQADETAYPYKDKQHGLFTYYLLKKLQESGGNCTMEELSDYVKIQVGRRSVVMNQKSQTPSIGVSPSLGDTWKTLKLNE